MTRVVRRSAAAVLLVVGGVLLATLAPPAAVAADRVEFERPMASSDFPVGTTWQQAFRMADAPRRVELMTRLEGTETWLVQEVPLADTTGPSFEASVTDRAFQLPNSRVEYRFRITPRSGAPETGPTATLAVQDDRIDWRTIAGDVVRLHWHDGNEDFARRALRIAEESVAETSELLGVNETEPIDFFVYGDPEQFQSALGPGTQEFVAGRAVAEIRTLFAVLEPNEIGSPWLSIVVPHELAHLVFDTATANELHQPPHWLNEGLATYLSEGFVDADRRRVTTAIDRGTLLPLKAIANGFPGTREDLFYLGYAEGASAIDFFIRTYGQETLVQLIRSFADGVTDDDAFRAATGAGIAEFEAAWLADLGTAAPTAHGPREARPGRTPDAWVTDIGAGRPPASSPPDPSTPLAPQPDAPVAPALLVVALLVGAVAVISFVFLRRRPTPSAAAPVAPIADPGLAHDDDARDEPPPGDRWGSPS